MTALAPPPTAPRSRLQFVLLFVLFFVPFIGSYVAFYLLPQFMPQGRLNYGVLVTPALKLPASTFVDAKGLASKTDLFRDKWTYIHRINGPCDAPCVAELILTRQTRQLTSRNESRVRRLLLLGPAADALALEARLRDQHPDLVIARQTTGNAATDALLAAQPATELLLVDPLGNWLMHYPRASSEAQVKADFKGLQKDLNKLLKLSHID